jgi:hypothetical protein
MRPIPSVAALVGLLIVVSMLLAGVASTLALARDGAGTLDADLDALITADYGADPRDGLAPLDPELIDDARRDESQLRASGSDVELVQVHRTTPYEGFVVDADPDPTPAVGVPGGTQTATPKPGTTPRSSTGTPSATPPSGSPGDTPTPTPGSGPTPPPTDTPPPDVTVVPTPTPTPAPLVAVTYYLHNNPSPPVGDTNSQSPLPLNTTAPTASTLYNYDKDRDTSPGLMIQKGGGADEADPTKHQAWRTAQLAKNTTVSGTASVTFWAAMKNFQTGVPASVTFYLRSYNGASGQYTSLAQGTVNSAIWHGANPSWVQATAQLPVGTVTVPAGHRLELKVTVSSVSGQDMWFAYDTTTYAAFATITHN